MPVGHQYQQPAARFSHLGRPAVDHRTTETPAMLRQTYAGRSIPPYASAQFRALNLAPVTVPAFTLVVVTTALASVPGAADGLALPAAVVELQGSAMAANTQSAYRSDWGSFSRWCRLHGHQVMPASPAAVCEYLADLANHVHSDGSWEYAPSTISRRLAAITKMHELAGHTSPAHHPAVTTTMSGIRRDRVRPTRRMSPLLLNDLRSVLASIELWQFPQAVIGRRDTALLVMGFAGAFRRSELAEMIVGDVTHHPEDGLHIRLRKSKTDQEGRGAVRALPFGRHPSTCPPCALIGWMEAMEAFEIEGRVGLLRLLRRPPPTDVPMHVCRSVRPNVDLPTDRPLFRPIHKTGVPGDGPVSGHAINAMVKRRVAAVGLDPADFGGHSLRAGFVTQAVRAGADAGSIMRQTGHRSPAMVEIYRRENAPLIGNAVADLGL